MKSSTTFGLILLTLITLLSPIAPPEAVAQSLPNANCPPAPGPLTFAFTYTEVDPIFNNTKPRSWITRQAGGNPKTRAQTKYAINTKIKTDFRSLKARRPGMRCVYLSGFRVRAKNSLHVYIGREFQPGSCAYKKLREHETEHVTIWQETVNKHLPGIRRAAHQAARSVRPVMIPEKSNVKMVYKRISNRLTSVLRERRIAMEKEAGPQQKSLDTPESYKALEAQCKRW
ncbi:MAG: hypothetical protein HQL53_07260 [Magnetococcales bacterium]|nr:hypothetical protein [Magnetococcales bacterium]